MRSFKCFYNVLLTAAQQEYERKMSEQLSKDGVPKDSKILAFQQKAPVNKEGRSTSICHWHYYYHDVINAADQ